MVEYKVFTWRFDLSTPQELEAELNKYGKDGWKVIDIVSNFKGSGNVLFNTSSGNISTFILEKS